MVVWKMGQGRGVIPKCQPITVLKSSLIATPYPLFPILISHLACHKRLNTEQGWSRERSRGTWGVKEGGREARSWTKRENGRFGNRWSEARVKRAWEEVGLEEERIWLKQQVEIQRDLRENNTKQEQWVLICIFQRERWLPRYHQGGGRLSERGLIQGAFKVWDCQTKHE